ncbi:hemopexin repeat-containing protein [Streptomyces cinnamoneus]|uniref:hemopexin repeat-containing protein n=1 Tax=Streptomyces cinnamoneus TaxID=53446 RepID=UPI0033F1DFFB
MSKTDKLYLAAGAEYVRITLGSLTADSGFPKKVAPFWPGTERIGFSEGFDMILKWDDTRAYLFKGPAYARYDLTADKVDDGYPKQTADYWPGMQEAGFADGLDAAVRYDNDTVYFFKGPDYVRYNITNNSVDPGYPRKITTHWDGLAAAGATRVRAAWRTA